MALPVKTTYEDVRAVSMYLSERPTGVEVVQMRSEAGKLADPRKLAAFSAWGVVTRSDGKIHLAPLGRDIAQARGRDEEGFRRIIEDVPAYRSLRAFVDASGHGEVTANEAAAFWYEHHPEGSRGVQDETLREQAVAFFSLGEGAGYGKLVVGRSGKPTRLVLSKGETGRDTTDSATVAVKLEVTSTTRMKSEPATKDGQIPPKIHSLDSRINSSTTAGLQPLYFEAGGDEELARRLRLLFAFGGYEPLEEPGNFEGMRKCIGGVIAWPSEHPGPDEWLVLGAALAALEDRLVLLAAEEVVLPQLAADVPVVRVTGGNLDARALLELIEHLTAFRSVSMNAHN